MDNQNINPPASLPTSATSILCHQCKKELKPEWYFCPNCGKKIKEPPQSTSIITQVGLYILALLVPPLGIFPAIKYLKQNDDKSKIIGYFLIVLTIISILIGIWLTLSLIDHLQKSVNLKQLQELQNVGI